MSIVLSGPKDSFRELPHDSKISLNFVGTKIPTTQNGHITELLPRY